MARKTALIVIGGNALLRKKDHGFQEEQLRNARQCAESFGKVVRAGFSLCIIHGNFPQVDNVFFQQSAGASRVPPYTLDVCDAMTQGSLGYMIEHQLTNHLSASSCRVPVTTVLTQVVVDEDDPAFENPTRSVGPFYKEFRALELIKQLGWRMTEDAGRGWRKVIAAPKPLEVVQLDTIQLLLEAGYCVIAGGGGGIPMIKDASGQLKGVEAVIDHILLSSLLAEQLKVDTYLMLTGASKVGLNFGKPTRRRVDRMTASEAARHLTDGQFSAGSMGLKIESALNFLKAGGREVVITSPDALGMEDFDKVGTRIVRD